MREITRQEKFWKERFGNDYTERNRGNNIIAANLSLFARVLKTVKAENEINSVVEFGCNVGLNLEALHYLLPKAEITGVEINEQAFESLCKLEYVQAYNHSLFDFKVEKTYDLAFTKGVLIHQPPEMLDEAYALLYKSAARYILIAEYYNPTPVEVVYHGNKSVLFKRDFCGDMLDRYSDLTLKDYGFIYHRDMLFPQDDLTWFLMEHEPII